MAKRFKLKISRVFQSCRSKDPSTLPTNPVPAFFRLSPVDDPKPITLCLTPPPPPSKPRHSIRRHVSSAFSSIGCGFGSRSSCAQYHSETDCTQSPPPPTPDFHWEKQDKWHVIAKVYDDQTPRRKIYETSDNDDALPPPPPPNTERKKRRHKKKRTTQKIRISTSSADSGLFSSESFGDDYNIDDDGETETLVSSCRSFSSTDYSSSEFNSKLESISEAVAISGTRHKRKKNKKVKRCVFKERNNVKSLSPESESPARLSMFLQRMIPCAVEGKVRESFAVVKRSEDPYEDFKRSMMEMILEKEMFEDKDLEQLLHCFLSLNARHHHGAIVQAFAEIWEALFCRRSTSCRVS